MTATDVPALHGPGLTDVRMMVVAHTSFRRELRLSPAAVRAVEDGDRKRLAVVANHVELFIGLLHHHHTIEDDLLWEPLAARVPDAVAPLVELMQDQHAGVAAYLAGVPPLLEVWRTGASRADGEALASHLAQLVEALCEHLDTEEARVLPLMAQHITEQEWEEFTRQGMESIPKKMMFTGFGMMLYEGDPEVIAIEMEKVPFLMRVLLPRLGRRSFRAYARRVHGTSEPTPGWS